MEHPSAHKGSYVPHKPRKPGGRRRTREQIDKDCRALDLHCQGKTLQQVADAIGWKSAATALMAIRRAIADRRVSELDQIDNFALAIQRCQKGIAECQAVIDNPPIAMTATGKIVTDPASGAVVRDVGAVQRAITEQRHLAAELNKLQGNYAPTKIRQEVITQDSVDAQIQAELEEIRRLASAGEAPGPGVPREP